MRVTFLTIMPSPYNLDLFAAMEADQRLSLRVLYMEMAAPDTHWGEVPLPASAEILRGGAQQFGGGRIHWNSGVIRALHHSQPDVAVVAGYSSLTAQMAMAWLRWRRIPWIFWGEVPGMRQLGSWKRQLRALAQFPVRRWPDAIAAIGTVAAEEYRRLAGPKCEVANIPYYTDLTPFLAQSRVNSPESVRILFCGQLIERKGVTTLLDAFLRLAGKYPCLELMLVGEGPLRQVLQDRVPAEYRHRVIFAGFQPVTQLPQYFSAADLLVLPSFHDGWGVVVNQALGAGLPIICSSSVGAAADLVLPGENGFVVPPADVPALSDVLERLVSDQELRTTFGDKSRKLALDWVPARGVDRWVELAEHVLARRHAVSV